jgi:hypothetical protein
MPEMITREFFENNDITSLPLGEILLISWNHLVREIFCFPRKEDIEVFYSSEIDICIRFCIVEAWIFEDISIDEFP